MTIAIGASSNGRALAPMAPNAELAAAVSLPTAAAAETVEPAKIRTITLDAARFGDDEDSLFSSESEEEGGCSSRPERAATAAATAVSPTNAAANDNVSGDAGFFGDASDCVLGIQLFACPASSGAHAVPRSRYLAEKDIPGGVGMVGMSSENAAAAAASFRKAVANKNRTASLSIRARLHMLGLVSSAAVQQQDLPTRNGAAPSRSKSEGNVAATAHNSKALLRSKSAGYAAATLKSCLKLPSSDHSSSNTLPCGVYQKERTNGGNVEGSLPLQHSVSFTSLEIRSYNVTLGDAPTPNGPPVSLAWEYDPAATEEHDVDVYERHRTSELGRRRSRGELLMPAEFRRRLLLREGGCTEREIRGAVEEARRAARRREQTARGTQWRFASCAA